MQPPSNHAACSRGHPCPSPSPVSKMATALPPRPRPAEPHPLSRSKAAPPPRRGPRCSAPAAPPRTSSTQVAGRRGSAAGGAYFPPLCEVEAGGPHAPPARGRQRLTAAASAAVPGGAGRPGGPRREAFPAWEGAGEERPSPRRGAEARGTPGPRRLRPVGEMPCGEDWLSHPLGIAGLLR